MSSQRRSARRRLRFELLEGRDVPAILAGSDVEPLDPPADDSTKPEVVITTVDGDPDAPPVDLPVPVDVDLSAQNEPVDPTVILTATGGEEEGEPEIPPLDLAASVSVDKVKPSFGDIVTVTIKLDNLGMDAATGVSLTTALPTGLTFVSATGPGTFNEETNTWTPETVLPEAPSVLQIKAKVTEAVAGAVTATIAGADQTDPQAGNNTASQNVNSVLAAVKLTKTASSPKPMVGSVVVMNVSVRNTGPGTARNVVVTDTLGEGLRFVRALTPGRGTFSTATKTWTIAALPAGMTVHLHVVAVVMKSGSIASPATMTATGIDPTRSVLEASGVVTALKANIPNAWAYFAGQNLQPNPRPAPLPSQPPGVVVTPRPTLPIIPTGTQLALIWSRFGLPMPRV